MINLEVRNVSKRFANHCALNDVSLKVREKSIFGLLGPNGAGKTTLIRIINQIIGPDSGEVFLNGAKLEKNHVENIGYLPEERGLYKKMKVGEQALYLAQLKGMDKHVAYKKLKYWFEKFEIQNWWNKRVEELSKGMQQKVQFIVTVIHEPSLLIFDEPFSGFDPINAEMLKEEILNMKNSGATVIISTHNMASVEELCDDIALINRSKVILEGAVRDIRKRYNNNLFQLKFHPFNDFNDNMLSEIGFVSDVESIDDSIICRIKIKEEFSSNDLLKKLINIGNVTGFEEILPSMNDIFISEVTSSLSNN